MNKQAISVTLSPDNLVWLEALARRSRRRSLSETLDAILDGVRGRSTPETTSFQGMISIDPGDPELATADAALARVFGAWTGASVISDRPPVRRKRARKPPSGKASGPDAAPGR